MRIMRRIACLLIASALMGLLIGCGGGSGQSGGRSARRKVTIQIQWPDSGSKATSSSPGGAKRSRYALSGIQSFLVEVYDGPTRIDAVPLTKPGSYTAGQLVVSTATLDLPAKGLTFFANAFSGATAPAPAAFHTDPDNGQFVAGATGKTPLGASDPHPIAHAVAAKDVAALPDPPLIVFTLDNAITSLSVSSANARLTLNYPVTAVDVTGLVQAQDATGTAVFLPTGILSAELDPSDTLAAQYVTVSGAGVLPGTITPKATGTARVLIKDSEVNNNATNGKPEYTQTPIAATIAFTVLPGTTQKTIPVNVGGSSQLLPTVPLYAKSVTITATPQALVAGDTPPAAVKATTPVTFTPSVTAATPAAATGPGTIAVATPINVNVIPTGRLVALTAQAWSNADGTGSLLAESAAVVTVPGTDTTTAAAQEVPLATYHVTGFQFAPAPPTLNLTGATATTQMQISALLNNGPPLPINPAALQITSNNAGVLVSVPAAPLDSNGNPYLLITASAPAAPATITATDTVIPNPPAIPGTTSVTVVHPVGGAGLHIN